MTRAGFCEAIGWAWGEWLWGASWVLATAWLLCRLAGPRRPAVRDGICRAALVLLVLLPGLPSLGRRLGWEGPLAWLGPISIRGASEAQRPANRPTEPSGPGRLAGGESSVAPERPSPPEAAPPGVTPSTAPAPPLAEPPAGDSDVSQPPAWRRWLDRLVDARPWPVGGAASGLEEAPMPSGAIAEGSVGGTGSDVVAPAASLAPSDDLVSLGWLGWATVLALAGSLVCLAWLAMAGARVAWLRRLAFAPDRPLPAPDRWRVGSATPRVLLSDRVAGPAVVGILRPVILLPASLLERASAEDLARALRHEAAHIARRDGLWLLLARLLGSAAWLHPLAWWLIRAQRNASEELCDNHVLADAEPWEYAESLLNLARRADAGQVAPGLSMLPRRGGLETRVRGLLDGRRDRRVSLPWMRRGVWLAPLAVAVLAALPALPDASRAEPPRKSFAKDESLTPRAEGVASSAPAAGVAPAPAELPPLSAEWSRSAAAYVPRDAVFFGAVQRPESLLRGLLRSNALRALVVADGETPSADLFEEFLGSLAEEWGLDALPDGPPLEELDAEDLLAWRAMADYQRMVRDMFRHELFVYGDPSWRPAADVARRFLDEMAASPRELPRDAERLVSTLRELPVPAIVLGSQLRDADAAKAVERLLKMYYDLGQQAMAEEPFIPVGKLEFTRSELGVFVSWSVSGRDIPWQLANRASMTRDDERALDALIEAFSARQLTVALGVREGHLLLSLGEGLEHLRRFGADADGERLIEHPELAALRGVDAERAQHVWFVPDDWARRRRLSSSWLSPLLDAAGQIKIDDQELSTAAPLAIAVLTQLRDDAQQLSKDLQEWQPPAAGSLSYSWWDDEGLRGELRVRSSLHRPRREAPPVLEHLGGEPLAVWLHMGDRDSTRWKIALDWCGRLEWYLSRYLMLGGDGEVFLAYTPLRERLEELGDILREDVLPAIGDEGSALVLAPSTRSTVAAAAIQSVRDSGRLREAGIRMNKTADRFVLDVRVLMQGEEFPWSVPRPSVVRGDAWSRYEYRLPAELAAVSGVVPHALLTDKWLAVGTDPELTERMLEPQRLVLPEQVRWRSGEHLLELRLLELRRLYETVRPAVAKLLEGENDAEALLKFYRTLVCLERYTSTRAATERETVWRWALRIKDL